jgi:UDP-glucuronate 4-epimerase
MAMFLFTKAIIEGRPIDVFNGGRMQRDFTYVEDIVEGVVRTLDNVATGDTAYVSERPDPAPAVHLIESSTSAVIGQSPCLTSLRALKTRWREGDKRMLPLQKGDVLATDADVDSPANVGRLCSRDTPEVGVRKYVDWYRGYYRV